MIMSGQRYHFPVGMMAQHTQRSAFREHIMAQSSSSFMSS